MTPSGIEPATFLLVAQYLNHCTTAVSHNTVDQKMIRIISVDWVQLSMINVAWSGGDYKGLIFRLPCEVKIVPVHTMKLYGGVEEYIS
jgi:hypothetical protein